MKMLMMRRMKMNIVIIFDFIIFATSYAQIDQFCPKSCECRRQDVNRVVDCSSEDLFMPPEGIDQIEYEILDFSNNRLMTIPKNITKTRLQRYILSGNKISTIDPDTFDNAVMLVELDLSHNEITHLENLNLDIILPKLVHLRRLSLSGNSLESRIEMMTMPSDSLEVIYLNNCDLNSFNGSILRQWPHLRELHLAHNPIKWLKQMESNSVEYLNLKHCEIDLLTNSVFTKMPRLQHLILKSNLQLGISSLISSSLRHLDASLCHVTEPKLYNMPDLLTARFSDNRIEEIVANAFKMNANLLTLDLSKNLISSIDVTAFVGLENVIEINLSYNYIKQLAEYQFENNFGLRRLYLSNNQLTRFIKLKTKSLEKFDVSFNGIQTVEENSLERFPNLKFLNLSRNNLEVFQDQSSETLEYLDLSYNRLILMNNETFSSFPMLKYLSLAGNRLTQLSEMLVFNYSPKLSHLYLADNPWECHCENKTVKFLFESMRVQAARDPKAVDVGKIRCNLRFTLSSLCWHRWYPVPKTLTKSEGFNIIVYAFMLILFLIIAVVGLVRYRVRIRREKDRRRRTEEAREAREIQARLLRQHRESVIELERRRSEEREHARQQRNQLAPPSYEEAIQLARSVQSLCSVCSTRMPTNTCEINIQTESDIETESRHERGNEEYDENDNETEEMERQSKEEINNERSQQSSNEPTSSSALHNETNL